MCFELTEKGGGSLKRDPPPLIIINHISQPPSELKRKDFYRYSPINKKTYSRFKFE